MKNKKNSKKAALSALSALRDHNHAKAAAGFGAGCTNKRKVNNIALLATIENKERGSGS